MSRVISCVKRATQGKVNVADQLKIMNETLTVRFSALEASIAKLDGKIDALDARITDMNTSISNWRLISD